MKSSEETRKKILIVISTLDSLFDLYFAFYFGTVS